MNADAYCSQIRFDSRLHAIGFHLCRRLVTFVRCLVYEIFRIAEVYSEPNQNVNVNREAGDHKKKPVVEQAFFEFLSGSIIIMRVLFVASLFPRICAEQ